MNSHRADVSGSEEIKIKLFGAHWKREKICSIDFKNKTEIGESSSLSGIWREMSWGY